MKTVVGTAKNGLSVSKRGALNHRGLSPFHQFRGSGYVRKFEGAHSWAAEGASTKIEAGRQRATNERKKSAHTLRAGRDMSCAHTFKRAWHGAMGVMVLAACGACTGCLSRVTDLQNSGLLWQEFRATEPVAPALGPVRRITDRPLASRGDMAIYCDRNSFTYVFWQEQDAGDLDEVPAGVRMQFTRPDGDVSRTFSMLFAPGFPDLCTDENGNGELFSVKGTEKEKWITVYTLSPDLIQDGIVKPRKVLFYTVPLRSGPLFGAETVRALEVLSLPGMDRHHMLVGRYGEVHWTPWGILGGHIRESFRRYFTVEVRAGKPEAPQPMTNWGFYYLSGVNNPTDCPRVRFDDEGRGACVLVKRICKQDCYILALWDKKRWHSLDFDPVPALPLCERIRFEPTCPLLVLEGSNVFVFDCTYVFEGEVVWPRRGGRPEVRWKTAARILPRGRLYDAEKVGDNVVVLYRAPQGAGYLTRTPSGWSAFSPIKTMPPFNPESFRAAASPDGRFHLVWRAGDGHLYYVCSQPKARAQASP